MCKAHRLSTKTLENCVLIHRVSIKLINSCRPLHFCISMNWDEIKGCEPASLGGCYRLLTKLALPSQVEVVSKADGDSLVILTIVEILIEIL